MSWLNASTEGFETCQRLKEDPETADIPVIFLTARIEPEDIVKGLDLGGVDYVCKPFNAPELMQRVKTHLMIRQLQTSLEDRINELDQAAKTIARMARENEAFIRHELNNALGPVLGYADMLIRSPGQEEEKRTAWAKNIKTRAQSIAELLEALKDLQAVERGTHQLNLDDVDVIDMVQNETHHLEMAYGVTISFESALSDAILPVDSAFLPGVFRNLIKNAVEHVKDLPEEERGVSVSVASSDNTLTVEVHNGGIPVPSDRLETFFEKFNSTKGKEGETGLGTSYAYVVVAAHRGTIAVTSSAEEGTCVKVELPLGSVD